MTTSEPLDVVTLGEAMVMLVAGQPGPLEQVEIFHKRTAGAETNVAIGLARLGLRVGWGSRLGQDSMGRYLLDSLRGEGVEAPVVLWALARELRRLAGIAQQINQGMALDKAFADIEANNTELQHVLTATQYGDKRVLSDATLQQMVFNVLDNAREASPEWVALQAVREDDALLLIVSDHGPGFAPAMLRELGKPYQSSKGRPGRGMGLFLVVNVARTLGGRVVARNRVGGGAVVTLTLPLSAIALEEGDES